VIYTSGTTGRPKGCELTHGNFLFELGSAVDLLDEVFTEDACTLLFLPLAHVFARIIEIGVLMGRAKLAHTPDVTNLIEDLQVVRPTFVLAVPRVFEKVFNGASQRAHGESAVKGRIFDAAADTAIAYSHALDQGKPPAALRARHALYDRLVYRKLRAALGGAVRYAISGGAPLGDRLTHFYRGIGLIILEGYGLTEITAAATVNSTQAIRLGTVGQPLPGVSVRVAEDGEIFVRGDNVMRGYWRNPEATAEAVVDGWFATGDLGELDSEGFLRITGRKKEIIVTAAGKNVAPTIIEDRVRAHALISQCMVVGDGQPYIAALVTLDEEALAAWAEQHGKAGRTPAELADDPDVRAEVQAAIDDGNRAVSRAESVRKFRVLTVDLSEQSGHLTPKMSLKRATILKDFAAEIDALYS
jgi:long-chain acyl-CoA synthetase